MLFGRSLFLKSSDRQIPFKYKRHLYNAKAAPATLPERAALLTQHHRHQQHDKCNDASSPVACSNFWSTPSQSIFARAVISAMNAAISEIASTSTSDYIQEHQTQLLSAAPAPVPAAAPNRARLPRIPTSTSSVSSRVQSRSG